METITKLRNTETDQWQDLKKGDPKAFPIDLRTLLEIITRNCI